MTREGSTSPVSSRRSATSAESYASGQYGPRPARTELPSASTGLWRRGSSPCLIRQTFLLDTGGWQFSTSRRFSTPPHQRQSPTPPLMSSGTADDLTSRDSAPLGVACTCTSPRRIGSQRTRMPRSASSSGLSLATRAGSTTTLSLARQTSLVTSSSTRQSSLA